MSRDFPTKIDRIKTIRAYYNLSLHDAKAMDDALEARRSVTTIFARDIPDARPSPEAVDWARVRVRLAGDIAAGLLASYAGDPENWPDPNLAARIIRERTDALIAELKRTEGHP